MPSQTAVIGNSRLRDLPSVESNCGLSTLLNLSLLAPFDWILSQLVHGCSEWVTAATLQTINVPTVAGRCDFLSIRRMPQVRYAVSNTSRVPWYARFVSVQGESVSTNEWIDCESAGTAAVATLNEWSACIRNAVATWNSSHGGRRSVVPSDDGLRVPQEVIDPVSLHPRVPPSTAMVVQRSGAGSESRMSLSARPICVCHCRLTKSNSSSLHLFWKA